MSDRGRALVDGRGAERVVSVLKKDSLSIRLAQDEDCKLLWEWANDPVSARLGILFANDWVG